MVYSAQSELLGMLAAAKSMELQYMLRADVSASPRHRSSAPPTFLF